jgi:superfamily II DNA or RNA helicase
MVALVPPAARLEEISAHTKLPRAVVRFALSEIGVSSPTPTTSTATEIGRSESGLPAGPDWSFQDVAVKRCRDSLAKAPGRKVGLVIPTGGGKTRVALRIGLEELAATPDISSRVLWVTHRQALRTQAIGELQRMINSGDVSLPADSAGLLAQRFDFAMLAKLEDHLAGPAPPRLVIVDEAHHAAAPSYEPLFANNPALRGLFLTATPNRTDDLPIGIDEIAFSVTYRELVERGVILMPTFEPFTVQNFEWVDEAVTELASEILARADAEGDFVKTLVIAPAIDRVDRFHSALLQSLAKIPGHVLSADDIGYVHSKGAPGDLTPHEYIQDFAARPRGILVSAQMLIEGFDDPAINAVVVTYPTSSLVLLMQAAGRCVRYFPGKKRAFVLQADNDALAYRYDQRWLYQEISDLLRPRLEDYYYSDIIELRQRVRQVLDGANVVASVRHRIEERFDSANAGDRYRLLLFGLPYDQAVGPFATASTWGAILETTANSELFRRVFNDYCALGAGISDPSVFLQRYVPYSPLPDSDYRLYYTMLLSMHYAQKELGGYTDVPGDGRPYSAGNATTWLTYVTFHHEPSVSSTVRVFLGSCVNAEHLLAEYSQPHTDWAMCVRVALPLGGFFGWLFGESEAHWLTAKRKELVERMSVASAADQLLLGVSWTATEPFVPIPGLLAARFDSILREPHWSTHVLHLKSAAAAFREDVIPATEIDA